MNKNKEIDFEKLKPHPNKKSGLELVPAIIDGVNISKEIYDQLIKMLVHTNVLTYGEQYYTTGASGGNQAWEYWLYELDLTKI